MNYGSKHQSNPRSSGPNPFIYAPLLLCMASCGQYSGLTTFRDIEPSHEFSLVESQSSPEIDAFTRRFYGREEFDPAVVTEELGALLIAHPRNATLHEMAANLALLRGDRNEAWFHFAMAASDLSSPFTGIYIGEVSDLTYRVSQQQATIELLEMIVQEHPSPDVRSHARWRLANEYSRQERFDEIESSVAPLGFITDFQLIGPFRNNQGDGLTRRYGPEERIDVTAELDGVRHPVRWREATEIHWDALVDLANSMAPAESVVAYLFTEIHSPESREAQIRFTATNSGIRVWWNGSLVIDRQGCSSTRIDGATATVRLSRGWNRLLIKSANDDNTSWNIGTRITDVGGEPFGDIHIEPAVHRAQPGITPIDSQVARTTALEEIEPPLRRRLLLRLAAEHIGSEQTSLEHSRELSFFAPENPVAIYWSAVTHWEAGEFEEANDLLNQGVELVGDWGAGFLIKRGRFHRLNRVRDRALSDLRGAIEAEPDAVEAYLELSALFSDHRWNVESCAVLEEVIERWPDDAFSHSELGRCLFDSGYLARAEAMYRRSDALEPGSSSNLERLSARARGRQDYDTAIAYTRRLIALYPTSIRYVASLAALLREDGQREAALDTYRSIASRLSDWEYPWNELGEMAFEDGDQQGALEAWSQVIELAPNSNMSRRVALLEDDSLGEGTDLMPSASDIEEAIERAATLHVDPETDVVFVLDDDVTYVLPDGSSRHLITQVWRAQTEDGVERISRRAVRGSRILQAYHVDVDGARQDAYAMTGTSVRFRNVGIGSSTVVQFTSLSPAPRILANHYTGWWSFQGRTYHLGEARWMVRLPEGRDVSHYIQGPIQHTQSTDGDVTVHLFTARNIPPFEVEPAMPPANNAMARVGVSTLTSWEEFARWEGALVADAFRSTPQLRALADRLTEGATSPRERLDRLYRYTASEVAYRQNYETFIAGVQPHPSSIVIERGEGDCKDKAVLLIQLARELGIDVHYALLRTFNEGQLIRELPSQQFNHAVVYVPPQEGIEDGFFLDPTATELEMTLLPWYDQGTTSLVLDTRTGEFSFRNVPYQSPSMEHFECAMSLNVTSSEAMSAHVRCEMRGHIAATFRRIPDENIGVALQAVASQIFPGSTLTSHEIRNPDEVNQPIEIELSFDTAGAIRQEGASHSIALPLLFSGDMSNDLLEERNLPLLIGRPNTFQMQIAVELPRGARFARTPRDFDVSHRCLSVQRTSTTSRNRASFSLEMVRTCPQVDPADYVEYHRMMSEFIGYIHQDVSFRL